MSSRSSSGHISVHRPFPSECSEAVATVRTCPMKSLSAQRCARIEPPEKCLSASVCSTEQNCVDWLSKKSFAHLQELDKYLAYKDMLNLRKKELLYKKWNEYVYEPVQWKVKAKLNQSFERRCPSVLQYLDNCNIKTRTSTLNDPLLLQSRSKNEEDNAILQCQKGKLYSMKETEEFHKSQLPLVPLGRQNIDSISWLRVPLGYIESEVRQRSRKIPHPLTKQVQCGLEPSELLMGRKLRTQLPIPPKQLLSGL
ncbi:protein FAM228A isoform X2 [Heterodontus francisci]|uniref:protein FAM228A isoform X2 n=1 Tax=Heterodontus francisci TaxID=7792 RepID=UPI00355C5096